MRSTFVRLRFTPVASPALRGPVLRAFGSPLLVSSRKCFSTSDNNQTTKVPLPLVKQLRAETQAGYADCQKALRESNLDVNKARSWLRERGIASASKRAGKVAAEGSVGVYNRPDCRSAVLVEINAETDFVARGARFLGLVEAAAVAVSTEVKEGDVQPEDILDRSVSLSGEGVENSTVIGSEGAVSEHVTALAGVVGENIKLRRIHVVAVPEGAYGAVGGHVHGLKMRFSSGVMAGGRAAAVAITAPADLAKVFSVTSLQELASQLAIQVVGFGAEYVNQEDIPQHVLDEHRTAFEKRREELMLARSAAEEAESKIAWNPKKAYAELALLEQEYMGSKSKVRDFVFTWCKKQGWKPAGDSQPPRGPPELPIRIHSFGRYLCGEGIEKAQDDFASEVEQMVAASSQ